MLTQDEYRRAIGYAVEFLRETGVPEVVAYGFGCDCPDEQLYQDVPMPLNRLHPSMHPFNKKMMRQVRQHPPSCLSGFRVSPSHADPGNDWVGWSLACACGASKGKLLGHPLKECYPEYDGPPFYVSPLAFLCSSCGTTTEIIDTKQHGYNSEISKAHGQRISNSIQA